jgi:sugar lactone lactonase YvrE
MSSAVMGEGGSHSCTAGLRPARTAATDPRGTRTGRAEGRTAWSSSALALCLAGAVVLIVLPGCLPIPPNTNPVANAGPDQSATPGQLVTLNGSASSDPNGNPLTFSWAQTNGVLVTLTGATTATPSFTAPGFSGTLTFRLTVNNGEGGIAFDTVNVNVAVSTSTPTLFVANQSGDTIVSFRNPASLQGNVFPATTLVGIDTKLAGSRDVIINSAGSLLVCNNAINSITVYNNATTATGNLAPVRNVNGLATQLLLPMSMELDTAHDVLYVANDSFSQTIVAFNHTTAVTFDGNLAPARTIVGVGMIQPHGMRLDSADNLYVANNGNNNVIVFAHASTAMNTVTPTRTLTCSAFSLLEDVLVDSGDHLFVLGADGIVLVFNNASTRMGVVTPDSALTIQGAFTVRSIAVDDAGTGYISDAVANAIYVYDNIRTRTGIRAPDRTIQGSNTRLSGPTRLFLKRP